MELARHGAYANHGEKTRKAKITADWKSSKEMLEVRSVQTVRDFNGEGTYKYYMRYDLEEVGAIIEALSKACRDIDSDTLKTALRGRVADLLKIANTVSLA